MLNKKIQDALNKQINYELYSAYLYLSMSAYFEDLNLAGFANWMRDHFQEETMHAMKIFDYINQRGGHVELSEIAKPDHTWKSAQDVFTNTLKHEQFITSLINGLVNLAREEKDHATESFLQWYVNEQVEEEATVNDILQQLKLIKDNTGALLMLDKELKTTINAQTTTQ
ncbi:MAG: ferritin [Gammaproteobacteria bacterium]|nr:ferritin [Gammaproteobacteria bacterium]